MNKLWKVFALVLAILMLCSCFAGCQQKSDEQGSDESAPKLKMVFFNQMAWIKEQFTVETSHGDCAYIELPSGESILVDTSTAYSTNYIVEILQEMGVTKIDYYICSHLHQDHTDGINAFAKHFGIKKAIWSGYGEGFTNARSALRTAIGLYGMEEILVRAGDQLKIGDVTLDFLWPTDEAPSTGLSSDQQKAMLNPYSLVFRLSYGDFSALFTGDITIATEPEIVKMYGDALRSTLLKVAHHGLETSTSDEFVEAVSPKFAVCMGRGMQYGNNNNNVQIRFTKRLIPVYGTFSDGQITVETDGKTCFVTSEYKGTGEYSLSWNVQE